MRKLLSANFARLWKSKVFWITLLGVLAASVSTILNGARSADVMTERGFVRSLDDYYFSLAPYMGLVYAGFISLFLGEEFSGGTIRNKLTVGHTRKHIYAANFLVSFAACLVFAVVWFIGGALGLLLIGPFVMGLSGFLFYLLVAVGFTAALASVFTWTSTRSDNKALTVVLAFVVWLCLALVASGLNDRLSVPETQGGTMYTDGEIVMIEPTPNPLYLSGTVRLVCECLLDIFPTGQAMLMMDAAIAHPVRQILFSLIVTTVMIAAGLAAFGRKDIK